MVDMLLFVYRDKRNANLLNKLEKSIVLIG